MEQGFQVTLEIGEEGSLSFTEAIAALPAIPELATCLSTWQHHYHQSAKTTRISLQRITVQAGALSQKEACRQAARELQTVFKAWLDSPLFHEVECRLREAIHLNETVRVLLRTNDRRLHHLPWQCWDFIERYTQAELAFSSPPLITARKNATGAVKVLAILGDRRGIDTESDRQQLETLLDAEVLFLVEPSRRQINNHLWDQAWDILFFAGHSQTEDHQGRIHINPTDSLTIAELKYGLKRAIAQGLQLAIFNSCDGLGLAYELEQLQLPQLIVMREPVPDQVAQAFLTQFLSAFAGGEPLYLATRQARERLQGLEDEFPCASWLPAIYQNPTEIPLTWRELKEAQRAQPSLLPPAQRISNRWLALIPLLTSLVVTGLVIGARSLGWLQASELWAYDRLMQQQPKAELDRRILLVTVTDQDIQRFGKPLTDQTIQRLLTTLKQYQPRVIGLDIYRDIPVEPGHENLLKLLRQSDRIVTICDVGEPGSYPAIPQPSGVPSVYLGFSDTLLVDIDGVVRRYTLATETKAIDCPTNKAFGWQVARHYLSAEAKPVMQTPQLSSTTVPSMKQPFGGYQQSDEIDPSSQQVLIHYRPSHQVAEEVSLSKVLDQPQSQFLRDRIVLIGYVGQTKDHHPTAVGEMFGIQIHAHIISQLLNAASGDRAFMSVWSNQKEIGWIVGWAMLGGSLVWIRSRRRVILAQIGALSILLLSCFYGFTQLIWIPFIPTAIALLTTLLITRYFTKIVRKLHRSD
ncbi:CHASE2 domain-containing protein [Phormidesmis sp. 146-35]